MNEFFRSMNFARWSILVSILGSLALVWFGLWQNSQLSESLKGESLQGEADMQSYIYKVATMDRVEVGNLNLATPAAEQFSKGVVDKKISIRPDNRERSFPRTTIANFLYTLEAQSRRVKVTMVTIENFDRRKKNHEIPDDKWTFLAEITSRQRSE